VSRLRNRKQRYSLIFTVVNVASAKRRKIVNTVKNGSGNEVWDRLPSKGYYNGCSRPYWYEQIRLGTIKSAKITHPGKCRGIRLIWRPSVLAFIEKHVKAEG
jgi:hypothetical protein